MAVQEEASGIAESNRAEREPLAWFRLHPVLWIMAAAFVAIQAVQDLEAVGLAPPIFDEWYVTKRYAFFDIVFEQALAGGGVGSQLPASTVTYAFLHVDWLHVGLNTAAFLALGHRVVEGVGAMRMLAAFALTAMVGAVAFGFLTDMPNPLVGASGAAFGFIGMITAWQERALARRGASRMRIWQRVVGLALINAAIVIALGSLFAWQSHLGGFVAGWLLGLLWRPEERARPVRT